MIKDLVAQQKIDEIFLVSNAARGVTNIGVPYFSLTLQDSTGQLTARKWEVKPGDDDIFVVGNFVKVTGEVVNYRNTLQIKVTDGSIIDERDVDVSDYIISAPIKREKLQQYLLGAVADIKQPDIHKVIEALVKGNLVSFSIYPAASKNHHEYASGLLHHTVGMLKAGKALCEVYPTINADLLAAGIILHDMGKIFELSGPVIPKYTTEGRLVGHISIMNGKLKEKCDELHIDEEVSILLQHMLLSSHGQPEFGSPVVPEVKEAEVLSLIDNLDARINMIDKAISSINEGEFTPRIASLEGRCFYKPKLK
ncbi:MAG: HD domain-containing protein [Bacilli bacterium]|nr:HD domain-containing protein [Bacilli bacterium]